MDKQQCVIIRDAGNTCLDITGGVAVSGQELSERACNQIWKECRGPFEDAIPVFVWNN
jgi:hypothetical protein